MYRPAENRPELGYPDVSATYNAEAGELYVNVLNRSVDRELTTRIESDTGTLRAEAETWQMNHPDLKATHTFGNDNVVRPVTPSESLDVNGSGFTYTFPAHSLTILRLQLR